MALNAKLKMMTLNGKEKIIALKAKPKRWFVPFLRKVY